jgi:F-type H+-transporting ATPase subunit delta
MSTVNTSPVDRIYAEALLQLAADRSVEDELTSQLAAFRKAWRESPELSGTLASPRIPAADKTRLLDAILDKETEAGKLLHHFLGVLARKGRLVRFELVCRAIDALRDEREGLARGRLIVAEDVEASTVEDASQVASSLVGRSVTLDKVIDPSILGGLVIEVGDIRADGSIRRRMDHLRNRMLRGGVPLGAFTDGP